MNFFARMLLIHLMILCGVVAWCYATGNIPDTVFPLDGVPTRLHRIFPEFTKSTDQVFEKTWLSMRRIGINIPPSHNERIIRILKLRCEISLICRGILEKQTTDVREN